MTCECTLINVRMASSALAAQVDDRVVRVAIRNIACGIHAVTLSVVSHGSVGGARGRVRLLALLFAECVDS